MKWKDYCRTCDHIRQKANGVIYCKLSGEVVAINGYCDKWEQDSKL